MAFRRILLQGKTASVLTLVLGAVLALGIAWRTEIAIDSAKQSFRREGNLEAQQIAHRVEDVFDELRQDLQTIARLPSLRQRRTAAEPVGEDADAMFRGICAKLERNLEVTRVRVALGAETSTGAPTLLLASPDDDAGPPAPLQHHVEALRTRCTQDPRAQEATTIAITSRAEADGLHYSVPLFGSDGTVRGCVSATLPTRVLQERLGRASARITNTNLGLALAPNDASSEPFDPDAERIYSEVLPLRVADTKPSWLLWSGRDDASFDERSDVRGARTFLAAGWTACLLVVIGMLVIVWLVTTHRSSIEAANRELEQHVAERTRELISANDALQVANAKAEAASRAKSEFLANMSHEIRTPMTAILGYADLLIDGEPSAEERRVHVQTIRRNGDHLLAIINDILDLSKIEAGKMRIEAIPTSPLQILEDVASLMRVRASEKHLGFRVETVGAIPEVITTDPTRLRQILLNLVGNAVKFTVTGEVSLKMEMATAPTAPHPLLAITITDTGIGMREDQLETLFVAFSQADASTTRKFGGTGLGLVITRRLAQMLGGDVVVTSRYGEGSTFTVTVGTGSLAGVPMRARQDLEHSEPRALPSDDHEEKIAARILLAEDGPDNQRLISLFLRRAGATVTVAQNGKVACELVERSREAGEPFDLILMDMQMPEMDGYTAAGELRKRGIPTPIIALTAHAMEGDKEKCIEAGCSGYATKPIQRDRLLTVVRTHLGNRGQTPSSRTN